MQRLRVVSQTDCAAHMMMSTGAVQSWFDGNQWGLISRAGTRAGGTNWNHPENARLGSKMSRKVAPFFWGQCNGIG